MRVGLVIPEVLYRSSARLARHLGISRTVLYWRAIEEYLERHKDDETNPLTKAGDILSEELTRLANQHLPEPD